MSPQKSAFLAVRFQTCVHTNSFFTRVLGVSIRSPFLDCKQYATEHTLMKVFFFSWEHMDAEQKGAPPSQSHVTCFCFGVSCSCNSFQRPTNRTLMLSPSPWMDCISLGRGWVANKMNDQLVLNFYMASIKIKLQHSHIWNYQRPQNRAILKDRLCTMPQLPNS